MLQLFQAKWCVSWKLLGNALPDKGGGKLWYIAYSIHSHRVQFAKSS